MSIDLESLGITKAELQQRVIDRAVERIFETTGIDEDGDEFSETSPFAGRLENAVKAAIDSRVAEMAEKHVLPITSELVENITLQTTNKWGEKTGAPATFREYMIQRAESYLTEQVSYDGKSKAESGSYSWSGTQTRITHLVHQHFQYSIESAMKDAVKTANDAIAKGIQEAVKIKLGEVTSALKVTVVTK
jgi:hypothetical protein